jgi:hypothetical protein
MERGKVQEEGTENEVIPAHAGLEVCGGASVRQLVRVGASVFYVPTIPTCSSTNLFTSLFFTHTSIVSKSLVKNVLLCL